MIRKLGQWLFPNVRPNPRRRTSPTSHHRNEGTLNRDAAAEPTAPTAPQAGTSEPAEQFSCPVCGTVHHYQSPRYRHHLCHTCTDRARCSHDRPIRGYNTHMSGGFEALHYDRGDNRCDQVTTDHRVWVDGVEFHMDEARFGGIVVTQIPDEHGQRP